MKQVFLFAFGLLLSTQHAFAQTDYSGNWQGAIDLPGMKLEISIHLQTEESKWKGFLSIPVQNIKDMSLADLDIQGRNIHFKLPEVPGNASFSGSFDEKASSLNGTFSQSGQTFPMNLIRSSAAEKAAEEKRLTEAVAIFRHLTDSLRLKRHTPGLAIGIVKDGKVLISEGFGYRDLEKKLPVTSHTLFAIGSSSKAFTTAGLAILADRGALDWEKPIITYMPDFKLYDSFATQEMTATDLSCHRSGLPRHDLMWYGASYSRQEIFERLRFLKPNKSFRSTWQYNNLMFMTAGCLIERLSGKSWETFTKDNIFGPLGMKSSNFSVAELLNSKDAAKGYSTKDGTNTRQEYRNLDAVGPAGSINSNITDMLQWVKFHLGDGKVNEKQVLSRAELTHLHRPQMLMNIPAQAQNPELGEPSYALGWFTYSYRNLKAVEHGGNIDGFSALVYMLPEKDFGVVILSNQNAAGINSVLARYASDLILELGSTDWYSRVYGEDGEKEDVKNEEPKPEPRRIAGTHASHPLAEYVGEYEHPAYGRIEIKNAGDNLHLKFNSFDLDLQHWHYDVFRARDTTIDINFLLNFSSDANGSIPQLSTNLDPMLEDEVFIKVAPSRLFDPLFLQNLAGKYVLTGGGSQICTFELRHNTLIAKIAGQPEYTLVPFQGLEFKLKELNAYSVEFIANEKGQVEYANFIQPQGVFKAKKEN